MRNRISCIWFLTDDVLDPIRLEAPERVREALLTAGELEPPTDYKSVLKSEWIYRRAWRYRGSFDALTEGKRAVMSIDGLSGAWEIRLNGQKAASGSAVSMETEVTSLLRPGRNDVDIVFLPPDSRELQPEIGFSGACQMKYVEGVVIRDFQMATAPDGSRVAKVTTDATEAVACDFQFTLSGKTARMENTIRKQLSPGVESHDLIPFEEPVQDDRVRVGLQLLVDGKTSDDSVFMEYAAQNAATARGFRAADEFSIAQTKRAGGNAVCSPESAARRMLAADCNLQFMPFVAPLDCRALCAMPDIDSLMALLGGDVSAFDRNAAWRLTGSSRESFEEIRARIGADVPNLRALTRYARYYQAIDLRARAEFARLRGEPFMLDDVFDRQVRCASPALFDGSAPRPAFFALADAWKKHHAFAQPPEAYPADGITNIPIYAVSDEQRHPVTVSATVYRPDGQDTVSASFPVNVFTPGVAGRICAEIPENDYVIVRTRVVSRGFTLSSSDTVVARDARILTHLPLAQLAIDGNEVKNVSTTAALGVAVAGADFFGAILPGERVVLSHPADRQVEGLNVVI